MLSSYQKACYKDVSLQRENQLKPNTPKENANKTNISVSPKDKLCSSNRETNKNENQLSLTGIDGTSNNMGSSALAPEWLVLPKPKFMITSAVSTIFFEPIAPYMSQSTGHPMEYARCPQEIFYPPTVGPRANVQRKVEIEKPFKLYTAEEIAERITEREKAKSIEANNTPKTLEIAYKEYSSEDESENICFSERTHIVSEPVLHVTRAKVHLPKFSSMNIEIAAMNSEDYQEEANLWSNINIDIKKIQIAESAESEASVPVLQITQSIYTFDILPKFCSMLAEIEIVVDITEAKQGNYSLSVSAHSNEISTENVNSETWVSESQAKRKKLS